MPHDCDLEPDSPDIYGVGIRELRNGWYSRSLMRRISIDRASLRGPASTATHVTFEELAGFVLNGRYSY